MMTNPLSAHFQCSDRIYIACPNLIFLCPLKACCPSAYGWQSEPSFSPPAPPWGPQAPAAIPGLHTVTNITTTGTPNTSAATAQNNYPTVLFDSETFFRVKNKGELIDSSRLITVDNTRIQADLQWIRDSSVITGKEYQIYLFIDRTTGLISSLHGEPGTNHDSHPYIESDRNHGTVSPVPADSPRSSSRILIGQVHGHPARPDGITLHRMSPDDSLTAVCLQAPIYAIDAMDGSQGTPGRIHRANPNPGGDFKGQDHDIGKTWGISGPDAGGVFNIGLNALNIWGISHPPYFERLKRIDELYMASQPRHHPDPDFDRGLVNIEGRSVHP